MHQPTDTAAPPGASPTARADRHAGRPSFALTDDQARSLARQLPAIEARYPLAEGLDGEIVPRQPHRPFVHDFVRAVHHATGRIHSAGVYRKLLAAYAPGRSPSTQTIETEKNLLEHDLRRGAAAREVFEREAGDGAAPTAAATPVAPARTGGAPAAAADPAQVQVVGLLQHLAARFDQLERAPAAADRSPGLQAHNDYLRERLAAVEAELATSRALAARMTATAQEEASLAAERGRQLAAMRATAEAQAAALAGMAASIDGDRRFFAMQVDGVRGETRAVRERCAQLEQQVKDKEREVETYRQMAFKGAAQR